MKQLLFILSFSLFLINTSFAQPHHHERGKHHSKEKREEIKALKIAHITEQLQLTPEEATKFWPLYNQFSEEMKALKKQSRKLRHKLKEGIDSLSEKETEQLLDQVLQEEKDFHNKVSAAKMKYHEEFKKILPIKKVAKLYHTEETFKRQILKRMAREKRHPEPKE